ncbi:MAG: CTP synthase [Rhodothermales bacterium]|nr:CTP synthase [Rhodothermales bacterium]
MQTKYIFVTGGVTSSLGKGIVCASLGRLLENRGLRVTIQKFDPYINVDPGTMNPYEHGEVYVTDDGAETDLDLGHYERFLGVPTSQANNVTTGRVYLEVINKERSGAYLGKTVQVVPHIIDEIKSWMLRLGETGEYDVVITEIGGTVGDIEGQPYLEAIRQVRYELGPRNTLNIHLTLVPYLDAAGEVKTKPTQHSVKTLLGFGLQPDILVCRTDRPLDQDVRRKLALFCNVESRAVIASQDAESIYEVPLLMKEQGLDDIVAERLHLRDEFGDRVLDNPDMSEWVEFLRKLKEPSGKVRIALVGKYVEHQDAYKSISESFILAGAEVGVQVELVHVLSDDITPDNVDELLGDVAGVLVAPGFGERGIEGKIGAVRYARENDLPFFGICLGMQCAVIEFARNVCEWDHANSTEFDPDTEYPVIDLMEDQKKIADKGGTMRLGAYRCDLKEGSVVRDIYGVDQISERHRHRFELNNVLRYKLREHGMHLTGVNPSRDLVEIIELPEQRWFIGVQFHPEYKSSVGKPHPLFRSFVQACAEFAVENDQILRPKPPRREKKIHLATAKM